MNKKQITYSIHGAASLIVTAFLFYNAFFSRNTTPTFAFIVPLVLFIFFVVMIVECRDRNENQDKN